MTLDINNVVPENGDIDVLSPQQRRKVSAIIILSIPIRCGGNIVLIEITVITG